VHHVAPAGPFVILGAAPDALDVFAFVLDGFLAGLGQFVDPLAALG